MIAYEDTSEHDCLSRLNNEDASRLPLASNSVCLLSENRRFFVYFYLGDKAIMIFKAG